MVMISNPYSSLQPLFPHSLLLLTGPGSRSTRITAYKINSISYSDVHQINVQARYNNLSANNVINRRNASRN